MRRWPIGVAVGALVAAGSGAAPAHAAPTAPKGSALIVLVEDNGGAWWSEPIAGGALQPTGYTGDGSFSPTGAYRASLVVETSDPAGPRHVVLSRGDGTHAQTVARAADDQLDIEGWTHDGNALYVYDHEGKSYGVNVIDARDGRVLRRIGEGDYSPDEQVTVGVGDRRLYFSDARHQDQDAGSLPAKGVVGYYEDPFTYENGYDDWSPDGRRVLVMDDTVQSGGGESGDQTDEFEDLTLINLASGTETTAPTEASYSWTFAPDGTQLCWRGTRLLCGRDLAHGHAMTVPAGGAKDYAIIQRVIPALPRTAFRPTTVSAHITPGRADLTIGGVHPADGGAVAVIVKGRAPSATPSAGRMLGITMDGKLRALRLAPATTYTVTAFGRSWGGTLSGARSVTFTTPTRPGTLTKVTITRDKRGRRVATARVTRADTGKGVAGRRVTLLGQAEDLAESDNFNSFMKLAVVTTNRYGIAKFVVPDGVQSIAARTAADARYGPSTWGPRQLY